IGNRDPLWFARWVGGRRVSCFCRDSYGEVPSWEASGSRVATPPGVLCPASLSHLSLLLLLSLRISRTAGFGAPTARAAFEDVSVMQKTIQHGGDSGAVAQEFPPVVYGSVGRQQCARTFVAAHDDLQQFLGRGKRQLAHSQVVDDEKRYGGQLVHQLLAFAIERGVGQFFQKPVSFAIQHAVALQDDGVSDGLCAVTFAAARRAEEQGILALSDPVRSGQVEDQTAVHLGIELEVEVIE